ncbi:MAG: Gfo/Idh/MocA family oxidoreductase [Ignavibacteria bacterium]|nr:Gfo/Idh/MocA family oxidoreductase [Ignavibacteria bacterium]MBT8383581.1 Gfo/Idh/MocA family oxidoreductase [Ignavibacteria bacterium]MBT8390677.1 Gfo/Idh/MocA family oxidoreductase [Ignavibacteria bacterium]NNJ51723.1 Gfo/Idh/MocA family oxidoreductase [Ignavibacteriaceae bacterium]NNL20714.1 Gfo/Idh/MocA family oxidoreductase [Ignavibacteriaceae bacterium]
MKVKKPVVKKLSWGVAGCGRYSEHTFIPTLAFLRKSAVQSFYSRNINRAKELADKAGATGYFDSYDEFLKSGIDSIFVASSNAHHYEQVIRAAEAGKNILCEKPMALDSKQAKDMVEACKQNSVLLAVNYVHRIHPHVIKAKEIIKNQTIGKLVSVIASFNIDFPPGSNFRFNRELSGGGVLRDLGTHMIDLLSFIGGNIVEIKGQMDNVIYTSEVEDFANAIVKFEMGGYGYFNVAFNCKKAFNRIEILGHNGAISIENLIGVKTVPSKLTIQLEGEAKKSFRKRGNKFLFMMRAIQKSFLKNQTPPATGEDGLINMKLMEELEENV